MTAARISTLRKIGLTLGLALSISTVATSSSFAYSARAQQMCMGDALRLCSSEIPNIARITACMRRNKANVSRGCRAVIEEEEAKLTRTKPASGCTCRAKAGRRVACRTARSTQNETGSGCACRAKASCRSTCRTARSDRDEARSGRACRTEAEQHAVEQPATTETKPVQAAPVERRPAIATPVEQPAATETKPVQAAPFEQRPVIATPVEVKPVQAKLAPGGEPVKLAQRKRKHRRLAVGPHIHHAFRNVHRTIGFALPIPFVILFYW